MKRSALTDLPPHYDLVIIGGGISGAGVFVEAARAGISVLLVEARDFASGTSSWSSKLVHGGLRYLANGQWRLTAESVRERQRLLRDVPDLVKPLNFLMPLYPDVGPSRSKMQLGLWLYDRFGKGTPRSRFLNSDQALQAEPKLRASGLLGGMCYHDARTDDSQLVWRLLEQGISSGGRALNYVACTRLLQDNGRVVGVALHDAEDGSSRKVTASVVVNATGVGASSLAGEPQTPPLLRPLRGSHLVFSRAQLPIQQAVSWLHPHDQRPIFVLPWQGATLFGTTDLDHHGDVWDARMSRAEVDYLMHGLDWMLPGYGLRAADALSCFAGVRPVIDDGSSKPSSASRESAQWQSPGYIGITGGKLTTFRVTARKVLQQAAKALPQLKMAPESAPLLAPAADLEAQSPEQQIDQRATAAVVHLDDLLLRRTRLGLTTAQGAAALLPHAAQRCAELLQWDAARTSAEVSRYQARIAAMHTVPV